MFVEQAHSSCPPPSRSSCSKPAPIGRALGGFLIPALAILLIGAQKPVVAGSYTNTGGNKDACRVDKDCNGYFRCLDQVCVVPPAVLGHSDAQPPTVEFMAGATNRGRFFVELATDGFERARGLSHRPSMAPGWGMLFIFPGPAHNPFTMALMRFPLDMIFIGEAGRVVDTIEDAQPKVMALTPSSQYRYVLELNAGTVRAHNIQIGDTMKLTGAPRRYQPIDG